MNEIIPILSIFFFASFQSSPATAKPTDLFVNLTKKPYYVDKTELLHVLSEFTNNYDFVACPSRFLKTSNLHMIKSFYQLEFGANGNAKDYTDTETYAFFKNFKIASHEPNFIKNRMTRHPVMLIDLKFNVSQVKTIAEVDALLNTRLREGFSDYFDVLPKLPTPTGAFEVTKFETEFVQKVQNGSATPFDLTYGLYRLSNVLFKYFKRLVIILVDNYDYAANEAVLKYRELLDTDGTVHYFYTAINNMFRKTFKENRKSKNYALMTGISGRIEYADNEVKENQFLDDHHFSSYFGFTEREVDELFQRHKARYAEIIYARGYYGDYLTRLNRNKMYSPYSIIQHILNRRSKTAAEELPKEYHFEPYWAKSEDQTFIKQAIKSDSFRQKVRLMIDDGSESVNVSSYHRASPALDTFVRTINERRPTFKGIQQLDDSYLFQYFFETGYLSYVLGNEGANVFRIVNREVNSTLKEVFQDFNFTETNKV